MVERKIKILVAATEREKNWVELLRSLYQDLGIKMQVEDPGKAGDLLGEEGWKLVVTSALGGGFDLLELAQEKGVSATLLTAMPDLYADRARQLGAEVVGKLDVNILEKFSLLAEK